MTISNQASGMRPGVCTSTTRPVTPYDGQVIYETDTDRTLVWNNSAWVFLSTSTVNPVGLEFIKAQTISTSAGGHEITNVFSSTYDSYYIIVDSLVVLGNQPDIGIRLGTGTLNTNYRYGGYYIGYSIGTLTASASVTATYWPIGYAGNATTATYTCTIHNPNLAKAKFYNSSSGGTSWSSTHNGYHPDTGQYTSFVVLASTMDITGGSVRVYGYKK